MKTLKIIANLFFLTFAAMIVADIIIDREPAIDDALILICCTTPAIANRRIVYRIAGIIGILISAYALLALTSDMLKHAAYHEKEVANPLFYFGSGYAIFLFALACSVVYVVVGMRFTKISEA